MPASDQSCGLGCDCGFSAGTANADDTLLSFSYDSLSAGYVATDANSGLFTARATDQPLLRTVGNFQREIAPTGNANFSAGFVTQPNPADIVFTTTFVRTGPDTGSSLGSLVITDIDGDRFESGVVGTWYSLGQGFIFLEWSMTNPQIISDDGMFNGHNGSWSVAGLQLANVNPGIQVVFGGASFFDASFSDLAVGVTGQLIPTPGTVALLGMAGLLVRRSRR